MTLDPVKAAEQRDADLEEEQQNVREAYETLCAIYMAAMKGPADFHVPTPGCGRKTRPVADLIQDVDDDLMHELFGVFRDAAEGQDVHMRAKLLRAAIVERHADFYAELQVYGGK
jgi:hypothetical protein